MPPLSPEEFQANKDGVDKALLVVFKSHRSVAYPLDEMLFELGALGVISTREDVHRALLDLVAKRRLAVVAIEETVYYRYDNRIGFGP